jgi:hypothetical protein
MHWKTARSSWAMLASSSPLVEANPNIGVGGARGACPASRRTIPQLQPSYLGPYYIVRRTRDRAIDARFDADSYITYFISSSHTSYKLTSLVPRSRRTGNIVVGQETTSSGPVGVVERLIQPASGSGITTLDASFNPCGPTPGIVTIATPAATIPARCTAVRWSTRVRAKAARSSWPAWTAPRRPAWSQHIWARLLIFRLRAPYIDR